MRSQHAREADRARYAAAKTLEILGTWLVPFPDATLAVAAGVGMVLLLHLIFLG